jgi:hypothetical protein
LNVEDGDTLTYVSRPQYFPNCPVCGTYSKQNSGSKGRWVPFCTKRCAGLYGIEKFEALDERIWHPRAKAWVEKVGVNEVAIEDNGFKIARSRRNF